MSTSHATNQLNLPDASVAGQIYVACNKDSQTATVGTATSTIIVDGRAAVTTIELPQYKCREFRHADWCCYVVIDACCRAGYDLLGVLEVTNCLRITLAASWPF